jgi:hypothetical protein
MDKSQIPVLKFLFKDTFRALNEALNIKPGYEVQEFATANDMAAFLTNQPGALIVASLKSRDDLIQIATFMKVVKKVAREAVVKVVVVNFSNDRNFEKAFSKVGIQDVVEPGINTKALKFKIDFWTKSLSVQMKAEASKHQSRVLKNSEQSKAPEKPKSEASSVNFIDPLDLEDDIWLLKQNNDARMVLSKWLIHLMGPSPYVGQWVELSRGAWRFDLKESEEEMFLSGQGSWFFTGEQKPEFIWKENIWLISGRVFELLYKDGDVIHSRFKAKDKNLTICKNSVFAKTKEKLILQSFDKELVFSREEEEGENLEGKSSTDKLNAGKMSGKNSTDHLVGKSLSGKNKTDNLGGGALSGKSSPEEHQEEPLAGKMGTDHLGGSPLAGKTQNKADQSHDLSGEVNSTDQVNYDHLEQKTSTSKEKTHWANSNLYQEETGTADFGIKSESKMSGPLSGKSSTDDLGGLYSGKNQSGARDSQDSEMEASLTNKKSGPLSGKSSTDDLGGLYSGKNQSGARDSQDSEMEASLTNKKSGPLSGKSSTDDLGGLYSGKNNSRAQETDQEAGSHESALIARKKKNFEDNSKHESLNALDPKKSSPTPEHLGHKPPLVAKKPIIKEGGAESNVLPLERPGSPNALKLLLDDEEDEIVDDAKVTSEMVYQGKTINCSLDDHFEGQIIFATKGQTIPKNSVVGLKMTFTLLDKETHLTMEGQVTEVQDVGEGMSYVTVSISKQNITAFDSFMKLFENRQKKLNDFLNKARGIA